MNISLPPRARTHWFYFLAPIVLAADIVIVKSATVDFDRVLEAGLLLDLAVFLPCLYWLCYRDRGKKVIIRAVALSCLGVWAALKLIPEQHQVISEYVAPLRVLGLAALVWLELAILVKIYRSIFAGRSPGEVATDTADKTDVPLWVAKLVALEASFWRRVWFVLRRVFFRK